MNNSPVFRPLWRWTDGLIALVVLTLAGVLLWLSLPTHAPGQVVITTPDGEQHYPLTDNLLVITGRNDRRITVEISEGRVRFQTADCPDRICVSTGWLTEAGDTAACVPAGITLRLTGTPAVDGIAG